MRLTKDSAPPGPQARHRKTDAKMLQAHDGAAQTAIHHAAGHPLTI